MKNALKDRFSSYDIPQRIKAQNVYPFFRVIESEQGTEVIVEGKKALMFGSNSYLGLTTHPLVKEAAQRALRKYGTSVAGSRFLNGTSDLHVELEYRLAKFLKKEAVLLFSTGFQVNIGVIPTITQKGDVIFMDRQNHASIFEGAKLSAAQSAVFLHNDMGSLEQKLEENIEAEFKLIIVDGLFSMEGDIARLPEIVQLAKKYNAVVMTDCAHAVGVLGEYGSGTASHFDVSDDVNLITGTFSKSLASLGGFVGSDADTINYMKHNAKSMMFSASITPASVASALAALDIIENDDSHRLRLWENTNYAFKILKELGFDTGHSESPIIPIYIRDDHKTFMLTKKLLERGLFVNPVVSPGVPKRSSLLRFSIMATHTKEQIEKAVDIIYTSSREIDVLQTA